MDLPGHVEWLGPFHPVANGDALVRDGWADVLLLASRGNLDTVFSQLANCPANRPLVAHENPCQILLTEQSALFASFFAKPTDSLLTHAESILERIVAMQHGQYDADQAAVRKRLAGRLVGGHALVPHLPSSDRICPFWKLIFPEISESRSLPA